MLLLDENLSPKLPARLKGILPSDAPLEIKHVLHVGLDNDEDTQIWKFAKQEGYTIITKDKDYLDFAQRCGHPPKVILLTIGNCRLAEQENHLKKNTVKIATFLADESNGLLLL
jgi:predicted nuclease of predicted toxin-antitoxin system